MFAGALPEPLQVAGFAVGACISIVFVSVFIAHVFSEAGKPKTLTDYGVLTLKDCFGRDFSKYMQIDAGVPLKDGPKAVDVLVKEMHDYHAQSKFVAFYIPRVDDCTRAACEYLAQHLLTILDELNNDLGIEAHLAGDLAPVTRKDLRFSGAVFLYHEGPLTNAEKADIEEKFKAVGARANFRGQSYATTNSAANSTA